MSSFNELPLPDLYAQLKLQLYAVSAALFLNGICLLLFSFAIFFLLRTKTRASMLFLALAVIFVLFALAAAILDVAMAAVLSRDIQIQISTGSSAQTRATVLTCLRIMVAREGLLVINNAIADFLFLYRCASIWQGSPWYKTVVGVSSLLIFATLSGRIWRKGRQASVVLGAGSGRRHNTALAIICESSLLYVLPVFIYLLSAVTQDAFVILPNIVWGALGQIVNIVPMMIMVRVGMSRAFDAQGPGGGDHLRNVVALLVFILSGRVT
ncbi:hypothetical protein GGX14DRAFT_574941 [Mycena pura]|uniref:Uncharacterized protein n=1 Tax=Mycena pura TaxID=153505 RepID=A0AAD6UWV1_9AGAR|nr:hypothetical protein GGX14DRAFT_574941 [Mycena pura]